MFKQGQPIKSGFVIKLSTETAQKLAEEDVNKKPTPVEEPQQTKELLKAEDVTEKPEKIDDATVTPGTKIVREVCDLDSDDDVEMDDDKPTPLKSQTDAEKSNNENVNNSVTQSDGEQNWGDYAPYITYEGDVAIYTDPSTQQKYTWSTNTNSWVYKDADGNERDVSGRVYSYEDNVHVYTEADGSKSFWDEEKKAWLPKVDDDFLAYYQMSYGFVDNSVKDETDPEKSKPPEEKPEPPGLKRKAEPQWFDASDDNNTKVYVSNLPLDLTEEEFVEFMQKCGLVMRDPSTQKMKIKFYVDKDQNCFKGDALCTYIKIESVELALKLLDGANLKGNTVKVERAHFQLKGEYNPALKPKKKKKKELEKLKKMQEKLFDWRPEKFVGERGKNERVVIVKNLFDPSVFDKEVQLILDFQQDLREECGKCGEVRKVIIYDRHPEGVAQVSMKEPEQADQVVALINNRWFGKRKLTAEIWDGKTKYKIAETDAEINTRIQKWDKFLESEDGEEKGEPKSSEKSQIQDEEKHENPQNQDEEQCEKPQNQEKNEEQHEKPQKQDEGKHEKQQNQDQGKEPENNASKVEKPPSPKPNKIQIRKHPSSHTRSKPLNPYAPKQPSLMSHGAHKQGRTHSRKQEKPQKQVKTEPPKEEPQYSGEFKIPGIAVTKLLRKSDVKKK